MSNLLRQLPKTDELTQAARQILAEQRAEILAGNITELPNLPQAAADRYTALQTSNLRRIINGTGIILHTNLGRSPLAEEAITAIAAAARGYSNLEYNIEEGKRSNRHVHIESLLTRLTGAEAAMAVNNNAAAVLLVLSALTAGQDVAISRGELVEIGGSFRIPDVMAQSGCRLVEVGATNKTHLRDLQAVAHTDRLGAILRVHTSNFKIIGFTSAPALEDLAELARSKNIPLIEDLGSGCIPDAAERVRAGVDVITFSGDKLLGGPQAGIILGRAELISKMKSHPLARALRIDKLSMAALEATLRLYLDPETAEQKIPTLRMLSATPKELHGKAQALQALLPGSEVVKSYSQAGGGALPEENFETYVVAVSAAGMSAQALEQHFRAAPTPVIGRISKEQFFLDVRTLDDGDFPVIAVRFREVSP